MRAAVANGLVQALTWRLRERRIRVGVFEVEQAAAVLSTQDEWTREELQRALLPIFCKRHEQRDMVSAEIDELLTPPAPPPSQDRPKPRIVAEKPDSASSDHTKAQPGFWRRRLDGLRRFISAVRSPRWSWLLFSILAAAVLVASLSILFPGGLSNLWGKLLFLSRSVLDAVADPLGNDIAAMDEDSDSLSFALLLRHSTVSALIATSLVAVALLFGLREANRENEKQKQLRRPQTAVEGDGSVFRVGSLGGAPPRFLSPKLATEIVELLGYRHTDRGRRDLDLRATLDSRVRGDMDSLIFEKRQELPTVVILADGVGDARYWNTIAAEFQTALERRGLKVEALAFSGPFFEINRADPYQNGTVASALETIAEGSGWMLTTIFGDLRRLSRRDAALLSDLREKGPVLAFDYNNSRLWDRRHEMLENGGIATSMATGPALRQALAAAFAPDRAATRQAPSARLGKAVFENLADPHAQWASACAMVQPVSFALAEKLRLVQPQLSGEEESLAFSLLANLPGSWVGPEGLRFSSQIRRRLLARVSTIPRAQQFAFLKVLDDAFGEEPKSTTAAELWRYTRAQAELFSPRQVRALQDLADIKAVGLIDRTQLDDFVNRLRQPGEAMQPGTLALPLRSSRLQTLADPTKAEDEIGEEAGSVPATWSVGLSEVRIRLAAEGIVLAAFLPGGRHILLVEPGVADQKSVFSRIDAARGSREPLELQQTFTSLEISPTDLIQLMVFPQSQAGVLATSNGRLFSFQLSPDPAGTGDLPKSVSLSEIRFERKAPDETIFTLSGEQNLIACCSLRSSVVSIVGMTSDEIRPQHLSLSGKVTAVAFSQGGAVLCGLENGDLFRIDGSPSGFGTPRRVASFGLEISALSEIASEEGVRTEIVAALADGRLMLDAAQVSENINLALPWRPRWLTAFPDRKAALIYQAPSSFSEAPDSKSPELPLSNYEPVGLSLAATGPNGEFDVLGLPFLDERFKYQGESLISEAIDPGRDGMAILAINAERRRTVVRNGLYIEVRPLLYDLPEPVAAAVSVQVESEPPYTPQPMLESVEQQAVTA